MSPVQGIFLKFEGFVDFLEKAVAVNCLGLPEANSSKIAGKLLENFSRIARCLKFYDFGNQIRQTCREPWVDTAVNLDPTFCVGFFLK